ncbi:hypothetical protein HYQ45_014481 [Verticillium longisporum]|uniref:Uncharacterized protein n=1 Tax=Verticillium longisporum TaxID=100787 RepID=A0A8I2ZAJ5_VERLO|nr:hypothetical protein HYQ45_014481 [Verticillium longisporum]
MVSSPLDKVCRLRRCFTYGLASPEQLSSLPDSAQVVHLYQFSAGRLVAAEQIEPACHVDREQPGGHGAEWSNCQLNKGFVSFLSAFV